MSLIFDRFPSTDSAEAFVIEAKRRFGLDLRFDCLSG